MLKSVAFFLYSIGILLALMITVIGIWPEIEAILFHPSISTDESLNTLRCPFLITPSDTAVVSATFTNRDEKPVQFIVKTYISKGYSTFLREYSQTVNLAIGESEKLTWDISTEDAAYERFVFARVRSLRGNGVPSRQNVCGVFVLDVPFFKGNQIVMALLLGSLASLIGGAVLWLRGKRPLDDRNRELATVGGVMASLAVTSALLSLSGFWGISLVLFAFIILASIGIIEHYFL